jgi:LAGLIDADG endonuclease
MRSDNPVGAENQQERLITLGWVIGLVDGEGCFSVGFIRQPDRKSRRGYRTGYQVAHEFAVTQGESSLACLRDLGEFFGVGMLVPNRRYDDHREHLYRYVVRRRSDLLERIIPFPAASVAFRETAELREVRSLRGARGRRSSPDPTRVGGDRRDRANDEPQEAPPGADQNPQRPYAGHPGHRMKRWSRLHGDMQGWCFARRCRPLSARVQRT